MSSPDEDVKPPALPKTETELEEGPNALSRVGNTSSSAGSAAKKERAARPLCNHDGCTNKVSAKLFTQMRE